MSFRLPLIKVFVHSFLTITFVLNFVGFAFAAPRDLDPTFDADGKVMTGFGSGIDRVQAVAVQPDGKIVVAGYAVTVSFFDFALVRYNADGSLDTTFDTDGKVTTAFDANNDETYALALQPDGKIVAVGGSFIIGSGYHFTLARYNTNGSLDTTFDGDGEVTTIMSNYDLATAATLQPDGKIVIAGVAQLGTTDTNFGLVRYNTDGSLDTSFDTDGKVNTAFGSLDDEAYAVVVQSNGKIVAAGFTHTQIGGFFRLSIGTLQLGWLARHELLDRWQGYDRFSVKR